VHGLYGDREITWTCKNVFWPKDLLPKYIDNARTLSFGYDAAIAKAFSPPTTNHIRTHAESLVAALVGLRARTDSVSSTDGFKDGFRVLLTQRTRPIAPSSSLLIALAV